MGITDFVNMGDGAGPSIAIPMGNFGDYPGKRRRRSAPDYDPPSHGYGHDDDDDDDYDEDHAGDSDYPVKPFFGHLPQGLRVSSSDMHFIFPINVPSLFSDQPLLFLQRRAQVLRKKALQPPNLPQTPLSSLRILLSETFILPKTFLLPQTVP